MSWLSEHALTRYWKEVGLGAPERQFRVGDRVRILGRGRHNVGDKPWKVAADDTNSRDPEPAYKLSNGKHARYIYESEIRLLDEEDTAGA